MASSGRILFIVPSFGATGWYRCNVPGRELAKRGHTCHLDTVVDRDAVGEHDVLVLSNGATDAGVAAIQYAKSLGLRVVADIDDDPWHMSAANPNAARWNEQERAAVEGCLSLADRVTTTNPFLAEFVSQFNGSVLVLPNCLPSDSWNVEAAPHDKTVIGWLGGFTHYEDLVAVGAPVNRLLEQHDDVELHLSIFEDHPFNPKSKVRVLPLRGDITEYPSLFGGIDIGIAPLLDNHFNRCKSDLKVIEYGAAGVPCVASDIPTYSRTISHGENGFLATTEEDWVGRLTELVEDRDLRARIGAEARKTAEARFIDKNVELWEKAYGL